MNRSRDKIVRSRFSSPGRSDEIHHHNPVTDGPSVQLSYCSLVDLVDADAIKRRPAMRTRRGDAAGLGARAEFDLVVIAHAMWRPVAPQNYGRDAERRGGVMVATFGRDDQAGA